MTSVLLNNQERHFEKTLFLFFLFSAYFVYFTRRVRGVGIVILEGLGLSSKKMFKAR